MTRADLIAQTIGDMTFSELADMATEIAEVIGLDNITGLVLADHMSAWAEAQ